MTAALRPHDLLWPSSQAGLFSAGGVMPDWVNYDWPVVLRRAPCNGVLLPVGLRGAGRSRRHAAFLLSGSVLRCVSPESLIDAWQFHPGLWSFPCVAALQSISARMRSLGLPWGPTGSTGFALASGIAEVRHDSDLDLVVRASQPLTEQQLDLLDGLQHLCPDLGCRIDLQIDTGQGAFAFSEFRRSARRVLLKTASGPVLIDDPWGKVS